MIYDEKFNGNVSYVNKLNKARILELIRNSSGISQARLAKETGLSPTTVFRIAEKLIEDGLVKEAGHGESIGGRPPTILKFDGKNRYVIGIDLGTTNIYGILTDLNAKIIAEEKIPTEITSGFYKVAERTSGVIQALLNKLSIGQLKQVYGIGIAVAGLINLEKKIIEFSPDFHWYDVDIAGEISKWHKYPIIFDNVTRVMALGELCFGVGKKYKSFIFINVGYGIGAGIVINGELLYGANGMAGEFGHINVEKDSPIRCECGNFGCLESLASGNALAKIARIRLENGSKSVLTEMVEGNLSQITAEIVARAAKIGDPLALEVFETGMTYLGIGVANLINIFNPEVVVMGGGVTLAGEMLFEKVRQVAKARALQRMARNVDIIPATFGMKAAAMGALSLILNKILNFDLELKP
ncbi:MAG: ROK family transcriptional regulator [Candidatus Aminicenantales bacterium]